MKNEEEGRLGEYVMFSWRPLRASGTCRPPKKQHLISAPDRPLHHSASSPCSLRLSVAYYFLRISFIALLRSRCLLLGKCLKILILRSLRILTDRSRLASLGTQKKDENRAKRPPHIRSRFAFELAMTV
jgi:hypothetical protein